MADAAGSRPPRFRTDFRARFRASNIGVHDYSQAEAQHLATPVKFCFASLPPVRQTPTNSTIENLYRPLTFDTLLCPKSPHFLHCLNTLRCDKAFTNFTIYPTTEASLRINELLWHCIRNGTYDPTEGDPLLGGHVFLLGLAPELCDLLQKFSLGDIHRGIIDFLVLLHHQLTSDGDEEGLDTLRRDLLPRIWDELNDSIGVFPNGEPTEHHRAKVLEQLVQISFMTPWRIDVFAAYLTSDDVTDVLGILSPWKETAQVTTSRYRLSGDQRLGPARMQGRVMLKLYKDWRVFSAVLHDGMGLPYDEVTEAMERAVHAGKSGGLLEQAFMVLELHRRESSHVFRLPSDVLERKLVPWIVRRGCEAIAPRHRKLASLKSLLEISSQYLEDLHAIGDYAGNFDAETSGMVSALLDSSLAELNAQESGEAVRTSDRIGYGVQTNRVLADVDLDATGDLLAGLELSDFEDNRSTPGGRQVAISRETERSVDAVDEVTARFSVDTSWIYPLNNALWERGPMRRTDADSSVHSILR